MILFGSKIEYDNPLPQLVASGIQHHDPSLPQRHLRSDHRQLEQAVSAVAARNHIPYFSYFGLMCGSGACENVTDNGVPLTWDVAHLTAEGSDYIFARAARTKALQLP